MISNSALPDSPPLSLQCLSVSIPLPRPLQVAELERSLQMAIAAQLGPHRLLRWAITGVERHDPDLSQAQVEAVVTLE